MSGVHPPETNAGTVTSWLPLTTPWPSSQGCSSIFLAHGNFAAGAVAYVFDPTYGISVDANVRCWPPEATTWWAQTFLGNTGTTLELGPFVCPAAYTTATTTVVNALSTLVGCCPSGFQFNVLLSAPTPGQCYSELVGGQVITYASPVSGNSWVITSGSQSTATYIEAVQVNGYIFASTTSSTSASMPASTSATGTSSPYPATSSLNSSSTSAATSSNAGLSSGATIGIAVGVSIATFLICCAIGLIFFRRYRYARMKVGEWGGVDRDAGHYVNDKNQPTFGADGYVAHEFAANETSHEMH